MRRYLISVSILCLILLAPACGEHGLNVSFPDPTVGALPLAEEPSFAHPDWLTTSRDVNVRIHGLAVAPLSGRPPADRQALRDHAQAAVHAHERHMTQMVIEHITRTLEDHGRGDLAWQSTRLMSTTTPMKIDTEALRVRYGFALHVRATPDLFHLLAPHQRVDPKFEIEVAESWWGDSESSITLRLTEDRAPDAFLPYPAMAKDGAIDIAVHVGDGSSATDPAEARIEETGLSLLDTGWKHPSTTNFGPLEAESVPFTRAASLNGADSELRLTLIQELASDRGAARRLSSGLITSLTTRDIVILRDLEPSVEAAVARAVGLSTTSSAAAIEGRPEAQLILVHRTSDTPWSHPGVDSVRANAGRDFMELRTTESSTDAVLEGLLAGLTLTDSGDRHVPLSINGLHNLAAKNANQALHLSVWGLDDNPLLNPYGSDAELCGACAGPGVCGAAGNLCVGGGGDGTCGLACSSDAACPTGYRCSTLDLEPSLDFLPRQCVPRSGTCAK